MPSNFKEKQLLRRYFSHLEGSVDIRMRDSRKFPAIAVFGYFFFKQIEMVSVEKSHSYYDNVLMIVSGRLSYLKRLFQACQGAVSLKFLGASALDPITGFNSTLLKPPAAFGSFSLEKRTILRTFRVN